MSDYSYKSYILNNGIFSMFLEFKKYLYKTCHIGHISASRLFKALATGADIPFWYKECFDLFPLLFEDLKQFHECVKLYNANKALYRRLRRRVSELIKEPCLFLTIDFSNKDLSSTTLQDRRVIICRYLKSQCNNYVANIDFGDKNGREHYHAIVQADFIDIHKFELEGWVKYERVWTENDSAERLSHYITKLTRHAIKNTTQRYKVIYSR